MTFRLTGPTGTWVLPPGSWLIGREADCRMLVDDARISRRHARFEVPANGPATVEDLGSANGVMVNGLRITKVTLLNDSDVVVCGPVILVVDTAQEEQGIIDPEPPRPARYQRKPTEEMTPNALAGMVTPQVRPSRNPPRPMDPSISAAIATRTPGTSSDFQPGPAPRTTASLLPGPFGESTPAPMPVLPPAPSPGNAYRSGSAAHHDDLDIALEPRSDLFPTRPQFLVKRFIAGFGDGLLSVGLGTGIGLSCIVAGWAAALAKAGAALDQVGLPVLTPGMLPPLKGVLVSLVKPGGLERAWELTQALRQAHDQSAFLLVFLGCMAAVLVLALAILLVLIAPTVGNGAPPVHRLLRLRVAQTHNGHHAHWLAATIRWLVLIALSPLAPIWIVCGKRGPHDLLAGTELRPR